MRIDLQRPNKVHCEWDGVLTMNIPTFGEQKAAFEVFCEDVHEESEFTELVNYVMDHAETLFMDAVQTFLTENEFDVHTADALREILTGVSFHLTGPRNNDALAWSIQLSMRPPDFDCEYGFFVDYVGKEIVGMGGAS